MPSSVRRAFTQPALRRKLGFTLLLLLVYRVGSMIPAPGVSYSAVQVCVGATNNSDLLSMINLFSGGAMLQLALFALGVMPYITASIIVQMLTSVIPRLEQMKKDGGAGQSKITQYTRYVTMGLAVIQAAGLVYVSHGTPSRLFPSCSLPVVPDGSWHTAITLGVALVAGTALVMWIGEKITEKGIGNGMSLLIMTSIAARLPSQVANLSATHSWIISVVAGAAAVVLVAGIVFVEQAQRRVPVTYAQKFSGGRSSGGATTYLPLKVNQAGVVPVIFASSLLYLPAIITSFTGADNAFGHFVSTYLVSGAHPLYMVVYVGLIVFFSFFYVSLTYNPVELSDNLRNAGGFIPNVHPGDPTATYLDRVLTRLTVAGSIYLGLIALLPLVLLALSGGASALPLGGTSLLILVGVGLETVKQLDAQLQLRRYPGLLAH